MTPAQFKKYLLRDKYCPHCGATEALVPHHRANRGMGGSKLRDRPSNVLVVCAELNTLMESNAQVAEMAIDYGWKLKSWQEPEVVPAYDKISGFWFRLANDYTKVSI